MLFLDEPRSKRDKVEAHLRNCWSCRLTREKADRVILAYMESRNASFAGSPGSSEDALPNFERKLHQLAVESGSPALFSTFLLEQVPGVFLPRYPLKLATFLGCLLLIVLVFFRLTSAPPVSAKDVLDRVRQAEVEQLQHTLLPVVHEKLRLHRRSSSDRSEVVTWEIWRDTRSKRFRHRVEDSQGPRILPVNNRKQVEFESGRENRRSVPLIPQSTGAIESAVPAAFAELEQVFRSHRADFEQPLSPDSFEAWAHAIHGGSEQASQGRLANGDEVFVLRASGQGPFLQNSIMSAELTVRKRDWQPVEERLQVKTVDGTTNYTLGKVGFEVVALNLLPPSIFAESTMPATLIHPSAPPTAVPANANEELPPENDLIAAEIEAWYSLHSLGACLGRPMTVVRVGHSQVEVQGVVETEERKAQILGALREIPHVRPSIRTVAEARVTDSNQTVPPEPAATVESETGLASEALPRKLAAEDLLKQFFAVEVCVARPTAEKDRCIQQEIARVSQQVFLSSEAALAQAWALRQLAGWYSSVQQHRLRISSRSLVELMVRDHLTALHEAFGRSQTLLIPALDSFLEFPSLSSEPKEPEPSAAPAAGSVDWIAASHRLWSTVERTTSLMRGMFVETNRPVTDTKGAAKELLSVMASLDTTFTKLEAEVAIEFSGVSKVVTRRKPEGD